MSLCIHSLTRSSPFYYPCYVELAADGNCYCPFDTPCVPYEEEE